MSVEALGLIYEANCRWEETADLRTAASCWRVLPQTVDYHMEELATMLPACLRVLEEYRSQRGGGLGPITFSAAVCSCPWQWQQIVMEDVRMDSMMVV